MGATLRRVATLGLVLLGAPACAQPPAGASSTEARAILFIGNSLTAQNDLPRRVRDLARDAGLGVDAQGVVGSGFSIGDHLEAGRVQGTIRSRRWELVLLQQGPSTLPESRVALVADATAAARVIREAGSEPALLAIWPLPGQKQADVTASYGAAAEAVKGKLIRAGDAWEAARERDRTLQLTVEDGFHPSPLGSHLAALTVHCVLHGSLPTADLARERERTARPDLTNAQVQILREAACAVAR
jgi:hypothetical protein